MHGADDETSVAALDQRAQLARAGRRAGLGVLGDEFDLAAGDAAAAIDDLDGLRRAFVVPIAPGRKPAGQIALMPDYDRPVRPSIHILAEHQIRGAGGAAPRSEERRVGTECGSTFRSRGWPYH